MADASEVSRLVRASAGGSETAWNELVRRYSPLVMAVTRTYQLTADDARDVSQTVWLRLVENLANLREPDALPGWLATTTQRECIRQLRQGRRVLPVDPHTDGALQLCETDDPDTGILRAELHQALRGKGCDRPVRGNAGRGGALRVGTADPVVTDLDPKGRSLTLGADTRPRGRGVLGHIGKRLRDDKVGSGLEGG